jgi:ACS family hexuronate transporter-like MFS transporter
MRWVMISLVFVATAINYLDRQTLSVVAPVLIDLYHMSNETYSRIIFAFMLAYTVMNGISGPFIDRLGTRRGYAWTTAWWSASAMLHAFTIGPWSLGTFRFLLGMGEAGNWPAGVKVVAEWFPVRERALASGIFNSGSAIGAILAPPMVVWIVLTFGWRAAFFAVGACGFVWLGIWLLTYYTPSIVEKMEVSHRLSTKALFSTRFVWGFIVAKIFLDPVWYFYIFWFPAYLSRARHFDLAAIGKYAWIPFLVAGVGNILGGWVATVLLRKSMSLSLARKLSVTVFACLMTLTIPAVLVNDVRLSIGLVSIAMLGYTGVTANMLAMPADVFPQNVLASIWGYSGLGSGFGGMLFALITGWLVDHYSYIPVFIGFGLMPLVALLIIWTLLGPLHPIQAKAGVVLGAMTSRVVDKCNVEMTGALHKK